MTAKEAILRYRNDNVKTQMETAVEIGISPTTLNKIEHGKKPSFIVRCKIERVTGYIIEEE